MFLIHGLDESKNTSWEPKAETQLIFNKFLIQSLHLDPIEIPLADIHRLPLWQIVKNGKSVIRAIIIKLSNAADKHKIMKSLDNLKACSQPGKEKQHTSPSHLQFSQKFKPVFVSEHLPKELYEEKKKLMMSSRLQEKQIKKTQIMTLE